jgi:hypothetical protein
MQFSTIGDCNREVITRDARDKIVYDEIIRRGLVVCDCSIKGCKKTSIEVAYLKIAHEFGLITNLPRTKEKKESYNDRQKKVRAALEEQFGDISLLSNEKRKEIFKFVEDIRKAVEVDKATKVIYDIKAIKEANPEKNAIKAAEEKAFKAAKEAKVRKEAIDIADKMILMQIRIEIDNDLKSTSQSIKNKVKIELNFFDRFIQESAMIGQCRYHINNANRIIYTS